MKQTSFFSAWLQKSALLLTAMLAFSCAVFAQANYLSVFGSAGCNNTNRMTCAITPATGSGAYTGEYNLNDMWAVGNPGAFPTYLQNSIYDKAGDLLFSVNADGIYGADGSQRFVFAANVNYNLPCGSLPDTRCSGCSRRGIRNGK